MKKRIRKAARFLIWRAACSVQNTFRYELPAIRQWLGRQVRPRPEPALATRRGRRTRPRPVTPPAQRPRPVRPAVPPVKPPPRDLIEELLSYPHGSPEEEEIWTRYLDRYRAKQTRAQPRKPVAVEAHTRGGAKVAGHRRAAPGGGMPRDPAELQAWRAVLAALVQSIARAQQQEGV